MNTDNSQSSRFTLQVGGECGKEEGGVLNFFFGGLISRLLGSLGGGGGVCCVNHRGGFFFVAKLRGRWGWGGWVISDYSESEAYC